MWKIGAGRASWERKTTYGKAKKMGVDIYKKLAVVLAGAAQWIEHQPAGQKLLV